MLLAGLFLFEGDARVSAPVLWPTALVMGATTAIAGRAAVRARLRPSTTGAETLIGKAVTVVGEEQEGWSAFLDGSWWTVRPTEGQLHSGDVMQVVAVDGIELVVAAAGTGHEH